MLLAIMQALVSPVARVIVTQNRCASESSALNVLRCHGAGNVTCSVYAVHPVPTGGLDCAAVPYAYGGGTSNLLSVFLGDTSSWLEPYLVLSSFACIAFMAFKLYRALFFTLSTYSACSFVRAFGLWHSTPTRAFPTSQKATLC